MRQKWILFILVTAVMTACNTSKPKSFTPQSAVTPDDMVSVPSSPSAFMPRALIYKTAGDFADNVPVRFDASRNTLVSFPAPSDLRRDCTPLPLADGWLLDRIGVGENTVFTRYTISGYSKLSVVPSIAQLIDSIIPGSRVTEIATLPMTTSEALADTAQCNRIIRRMRR